MDRLAPDTPVQYLKGIGPKKAAAYAKIGIHTVADLLFHLPREYQDRTRIYSLGELEDGQTAAFRGIVAQEPRLSRIRKGLNLTKFTAVDGTGRIELTYFNQPYLSKNVHRGDELVFYGRVSRNLLRLSAVNPEMEPSDGNADGKIVAVYPLTGGISQHVLRANIAQALPACAELSEYVPEKLRVKYDLMPISDAVRIIHAPADPASLEEAKHRLCFEELFLFQIKMLVLRSRRTALHTRPLEAEGTVEAYCRLLPFAPTGAQRRCMEEIAADLARPTPMSRLLQGDVGSGKTAVAAAGIFHAAKSGAQSALMVPTEILANQHYQSLAPILERSGIQYALLTASTPAREKKRITAGLASGEIQLVIGTHALIGEGVEFDELGLVITDEQHRFGVRQRAELASKGNNPHVLVMSATPIPRSLGFVLYGDLDISVIDELPPGRQRVDTFAVDSSYRKRVYEFIRKEARAGHQAFVVCPAIEDDETEQHAAVESYTEKLRETLPELRIEFVHGRMKPADRAAVMESFAAGGVDVLVATTVIEVGISVPKASLMIVENAERFGLSQLHQLRGRVGRGDIKSYCILISDARGGDARERLSVMKEVSDGFEIARRDFEIRGPGDFFGVRQHGENVMKIADVFADAAVLYQARSAAEELLADDPSLRSPRNAALLEKLGEQFYGRDKDIFN